MLNLVIYRYELLAGDISARLAGRKMGSLNLKVIQGEQPASSQIPCSYLVHTLFTRPRPRRSKSLNDMNRTMIVKSKNKKGSTVPVAQRIKKINEALVKVCAVMIFFISYLSFHFPIQLKMKNLFCHKIFWKFKMKIKISKNLKSVKKVLKIIFSQTQRVQN